MSSQSCSSSGSAHNRRHFFLSQQPSWQAVGVSLKPGLALALQLQAVGAGCDFDSNVGAPLLFGDIPPARPDSHQTAAKD
jgi:hypothetical protein